MSEDRAYTHIWLGKGNVITGVCNHLGKLRLSPNMRLLDKEYSHEEAMKLNGTVWEGEIDE